MFGLHVILAFVLLQAPAGDEPTLAGRVQDAVGGPVVGATVEVSCGDVLRQSTTTAGGEFRFEHLPAAVCSVTVTALDRQERVDGVELTRRPGSSMVVTLRLPRFSIQVVASPTPGMEERLTHVPESISVATRAAIDSRPFALAAEVLAEEAGVLVQQTTSAQASPVIRGFTGQGNLYLIDGVRLNQASWRSGPSQYLAWLNPAIVDRLEVVRGSGSVQYGSDALGGTVQAMMATPAMTSGGLVMGGNATLSLSSANHGRSGSADLVIRHSRAAVRFGGGISRLEDLRPGGGADSHSAVTRYLGLPSSLVGPRMRGTGFEQKGAYVSARMAGGARGSFRVLYLHEEQSGVSRYDRTLGGQGVFRSGFQPQTLNFGLLRYERSQLAGFDQMSATLSLNRQGDGRFEQARPTSATDQQVATSTALGYQVQARRRLFSRVSVTTGADYFDEAIAASREIVDPVTGRAQAARPDIPNGTTYSSKGVFALVAADLLGGRLALRGGARYGRFGFASVADASFGVPDERMTTSALTYQAGIVVRLASSLNATAQVSRGFRAANASDLGGVGLTGGGGMEITPSEAAALRGGVGTTAGVDALPTGVTVPALGPEHVDGYEVGLKLHGKRIAAAASVFDLEFLDSIQRRAVVFSSSLVGTSIGGFDVVRQDGGGLAYIAEDVRPIVTRVNVDHARIVGVVAEGQVALTDHWTSRAFFSMARGHVVETGQYLRRMPPPMGGASVRWTNRSARWWIEAATRFARAQTRLDSADLSDARIGAVRTRASIATFFNGTATDLGLVRGGVVVATGETLAAVQNRVLGTASSGQLFVSTPGFATVGMRAGYRVSPHAEVVVLGENLTDRNYRVHGSGLDAAGRSVLARIQLHF